MDARGEDLYRKTGRFAPNEPLPSGAEQLIESCQGLVRNLAWKVHRKLPPYVDLEDLIGFGQVGLVEAARNFDPERGGKFVTYAYYRVRGAIFDGLSKMNWFRQRDYHASRYEHMAVELLGLEGEGDAEGEATLEDDARWFGNITTSLAVVYLASGRESGRGRDDWEDRLADGGPSPDAAVLEKELREALRQVIEALPSDAGRLIRDVYYEGRTLEEAGRHLGISKAWASRLHARTLQRLAYSLRRLGIGDER